MAVTNGYCTVEDLRSHLQDSGSRLDTGLLEKAITAASRAVDQHTGRRFWKDGSPTVRTYRTPYRDMAWVDDIATTTGLEVETDDNGDGTWATSWTLGTDFELWPDNADKTDTQAYAWWRIEAIGNYLFPYFATRRRTLRVTAIFGWSAVPDAVNSATILKAASLFQRKDAVFGVAGFGEFGPVRITRKDPDVIDLLHDYVRGWM